ncbi:MAG: type II toxin-antitoxin system HicA family toxin [Burkholderiaceae bacterium]|nr:type II toxin-antitoxin system HicA family toxin [Burkholderiaceae bacterium]
MPKLPRVSGAEAVRALERLGFSKVRQSGSHLVMRRGERGCVVPVHSELKVGTSAAFAVCGLPPSRIETERFGRRALEPDRGRGAGVRGGVPQYSRSGAAKKNACPGTSGKRLIRKQFLWRARQDSNPRPPGS